MKYTILQIMADVDNKNDPRYRAAVNALLGRWGCVDVTQYEIAGIIEADSLEDVFYRGNDTKFQYVTILHPKFRMLCVGDIITDDTTYWRVERLGFSKIEDVTNLVSNLLA